MGECDGECEGDGIVHGYPDEVQPGAGGSNTSDVGRTGVEGKSEESTE